MENRNTPENRDMKPEHTDTTEIVRRHLEDPNHVITDEDIRNVKIVGTNDSEAVITGAEAEAKFGTGEDEDSEKDAPSKEPGTPWDVLSE